MACEHTLPSDMGYGMGMGMTLYDQKIAACNEVIDHLMECLEHAAEAGMKRSALAAALDDANSCRARLQSERDERFCPGCGADLTDPEDDCGCPDEPVSQSHRQERDMPSWDAGH